MLTKKVAINSKKAQLTVFIIVGIALAVSIGVVVYLQQQKVTVPVEETVVLPTIAAVPTDVQPIQDFITSCIAQVAEQGVRELGLQGGYLNPVANAPAQTKFSGVPVAGYIFNKQNPTASDAVEYNGAKVPYWWYLSSPNDCIPPNCAYSSLAPPLKRNTATQYGVQSQFAIETQIDDYVSANLKDCLGDFKQFREQGWTFNEAGRLGVETTVTAKQVNIFVAWPIVAKKDGIERRLENYISQLDVSLTDVYALATTLTNLEIDYSALANNFGTQLAIFSRNDPDALPPTDEGLGSGDRGSIWIKSDVENKIREMLATYIPLFNVVGIMDPPTVACAGQRDPAMCERLYSSFRWTTFTEDNPTQIFPDLSVKFAYLPDWAPFFELSNCKGGICQCTSVSGFFGQLARTLGMGSCEFVYDISYPVAVTIEQPEAFNGKGYTFQFFLEANVRNNDPLDVDAQPLTTPTFTSSSMLCDQAKWTPYNVTVSVTNGQTGGPAEGASVFYTLGDRSCAIGTTDASGKLVSKFPSGIDGVVEAQLTDAQPGRTGLSTPYDEPVSSAVELAIEPYRQVDFSLKKLTIDKIRPVLSKEWVDYDPENPGEGEFKTVVGEDWVWTPKTDKNLAENLTSGEHATIQLEKKTSGNEDRFFAFAEIDPDAAPADALFKNVSLVPGEYTVTINLAKRLDRKIVIPPELSCVKSETHVLAADECEAVCIPSTPIVFDAGKEMYVGAAELDWRVTADELNSAKEIVFYAPFLNFESVTDNCHVITRHKYRDSEEHYSIDDPSHIIKESDSSWGCGSGMMQRTETKCEREITDLEMLNIFQTIVGNNGDAFSPTRIPK